MAGRTAGQVDFATREAGTAGAQELLAIVSVMGRAQVIAGEQQHALAGFLRELGGNKGSHGLGDAGERDGFRLPCRRNQARPGGGSGGE